MSLPFFNWRIHSSVTSLKPWNPFNYWSLNTTIIWTFTRNEIFFPAMHVFRNPRTGDHDTHCSTFLMRIHPLLWRTNRNGNRQWQYMTICCPLLVQCQYPDPGITIFSRKRMKYAVHLCLKQSQREQNLKETYYEVLRNSY